MIRLLLQSGRHLRIFRFLDVACFQLAATNGAKIYFKEGCELMCELLHQKHWKALRASFSIA